jgi:transcriptional regulator with PAS, ATPase and Fis domain
MVREGKFRADLYQRISTIVVQIPPLRGRREDIIDIADGWWLDMGWGRLSKRQLEALTDYDYPGNVRELINILDRARALDEPDFKKLIREHKAINSDLRPEDSYAGVLPDNLADAMRLHVRSVFEKHGRSLTAAKAALGISLNTLKKYLGSAVNI